MIEVLIVSRLATVRVGLRTLLAASPAVHVAGEGAVLDDATLADADGAAGVVLLDATTLDHVDDAVAALDRLGIGLVVLGPTGGVRRLTLARPTFAWAFLAREAAPDRIIAAVQAVAAGLVAYEAEAGVDGGAFAARTDGPLPDTADLDDLTGREREVLALVAMGLTNKAVAQRLNISEHTAKFHVASILAKLGADSRTEAVHLAVRRGLLPV